MQTLDVIKEKHQDDNEKCSEMFEHWLDDDFNANWNKMEDALIQKGYNELAANINRNDDIKG